MTILVLAQSLKLATVAEGVETEEQATFLREHGCDTLQGFLFARPAPGDTIARLLPKARTGPSPAETAPSS